MRYLVLSRKPGSAWMFRMKTPAVLVGTIDPETRRPFVGTIKRGLGTNHLPDARRARDILLGQIRALAKAMSESPSAQVSDAMAEGWHAEIAAQDARGGPDVHFDEDTGEVTVGEDVRDIAEDIAEQVAAANAKNAAVLAQVTRFRNKTLRRGFRLEEALAGYLEAREVGNRANYKPLALTTQNALKTAVDCLVEHLKKPVDEIMLEDVTSDVAHDFRTVFLPGRKTKRAPKGLSHKTVGKHATLLSGIWGWAIEVRRIKGPSNPWEAPARHVPRGRTTKTGADKARDMFQPEDTAKLLAALPRGSRLGDLFRLSLVTGCRVDEIAKLKRADVVESGGEAIGFHIREGKTANAARYVPVPEIARALLTRTPEADDVKSGRGRRLRTSTAAEDAARLFPEFGIRAASGKAAAASQAFTRARREILGEDTDGRLGFHSARHTWMTLARRAGVPADVVNELGGWAGPKRSNLAYDHGMGYEQLEESQERAAVRLEQDGFLNGF